MSFSFSISPSNEYSGMISFRMDWLDLLAVLKEVLYSGNIKYMMLPFIAEKNLNFIALWA